MPALTTYTINNYYDRFNKIEVTFTKKIIELIKLISEDVFVKCGSATFPCIINSTSMKGAQIIIDSSNMFFDHLRKNNQKVFLRFAFRRMENTNPLTFFIQSKVEGYTPLPQKKNLYFMRLTYMQRPPDDLIGILGMLLEEASSNMAKRKEERIIVTPDVLRSLKIQDSRCVILAENGKMLGLLRDISPSGAKLIVQGTADVLINKQLTLCIQFEGETDTCNLSGDVKRTEEIKERDDFIALGVEFNDSPQLKGFQRIIANYLKSSS
jgi:hypothetical protein